MLRGEDGDGIEKIVFKRLALPESNTHMCRDVIQARMSSHHQNKVI